MRVDPIIPEKINKKTAKLPDLIFIHKFNNMDYFNSLINFLFRILLLSLLLFVSLRFLL